MIRKDNTLPDNVLFPECSAVLDEYVTPLHYKDLTRMAVERLGYNLDGLNKMRQVEDVRERFPRACRRDYGVLYTGAPQCLMVKRHWFPVVKPMLFNADSVDRPMVMPSDFRISIEGAAEALSRAPYMQAHGSDADVRNLLRARGLMIEAHIKNWFRKQYPRYYREPSNHRQWTKPASEDFLLYLGGAYVKVDVATPGRDGRYGSPKNPADLHFLCRHEGNLIIWEGVVTGKTWKELMKFTSESTMSPYVILARLNCQVANIDYSVLLNTLTRQ